MLSCSQTSFLRTMATMSTHAKDDNGTPSTTSRKDDSSTSSTAGAGAGAKKVDPFFMASMTFAHGVVRDCDCDECGLEPIPQSIKDAVRKHKRAKLMSVVQITHQERYMVKRDGGLSIWRLILPVGSEPLVEYGSSHRIVLVKSMSDNVEVKSIGTGIVGSAAEEKARQSVGWKAGGGYVVPSNGGKAVGWVCTKKDDENEESSTGSASVEVLIIKATPGALSIEQDDEESEKKWTKAFKEIFNKELPSGGKAAGTDEESVGDSKELSSTSVTALQQLVEQLMESS